MCGEYISGTDNPYHKSRPLSLVLNEEELRAYLKRYEDIENGLVSMLTDVRALKRVALTGLGKLN